MVHLGPDNVRLGCPHYGAKDPRAIRVLCEICGWIEVGPKSTTTKKRCYRHHRVLVSAMALHPDCEVYVKATMFDEDEDNRWSEEAFGDEWETAIVLGEVQKIRNGRVRVWSEEVFLVTGFYM